MTRKFLARENGIPVQVDESEISVEVPTKVSQLENDSGYATASEVDAKAAGYLPLSGGTMTGVINGVPGGVTVSGTSGDLIAARSKNTSTGHDIWLGVGESGSNRGIYDQKLDKWIIYVTGDNVRTAFPMSVAGGITAGGLIKGTRIGADNGVNTNLDFMNVHDSKGGGWYLPGEKHTSGNWEEIATVNSTVSRAKAANSVGIGGVSGLNIGAKTFSDSGGGTIVKITRDAYGRITALSVDAPNCSSDCSTD